MANKLREQGYYVTEIEKANEKKLNRNINIFNRVSIKDLTLYARQFATMVKAGLSLIRTLNILSDQMTNSKLKQATIEVRESIEEGATLSEALGEHPNVFPQIFVSMVEAGEASGELDTVLENLADHFERENDLKQKVSSAVIYPLIVLGVAVLLVCFLLIWVLPTFIKIFSDLNVKLPLITRSVLQVSKVFTNYWYLVLLGVVGLATGGYFYYRSNRGRRRIDWLLLKLPVIGDLIMKVSIVRFTKTLSILLGSGVSLLESLSIVSRSISNKIVANKISSARKHISEGESIIIPLSQNQFFPQMVLQMIKVGEETGELREMLQKAADFYDNEVEHKVEQVVSFIEPALIIGLGLVVGTIVISIMLPLFNLIQGI